MNNQIKNMVSSIVDWYAERVDGLLTLETENVPENDLNNLTALILSSNDMLASEATGPDNPEWEKSMQPALLRALKNQKNGYNMEEFHDIWTSGVRAYLMPEITRMIDDRLQDLNEDSGCHTTMIWDRATEKAVEHRI